MIEQSDWNGVYYDRETGDYVLFDVGEDQVIERDAFDGGVIHEFTHDEFAETTEVGLEFSEVSGFVLTDPAGVLDEFVRESLATADDPGRVSDFRGDEIDVEFALEALRFKRDNSAAWVERIH